MEKSWAEWAKENLERGCNTHEIRDILLKNHFTMGAVHQMMGDHFPGDPHDTKDSFHYRMPPDMYKALTEIRITRPAVPALHGPKPIERIETDLMQLYVLENFISDEECEGLNAIIRTELRPSTVTVDNGDRYFRTSSTCDLHNQDHPLVKTVDHKMAAALGINHSYSEEIQAQLYLKGQQFKAHTDCFPPYTPEYEKYAGVRGNRTWTFMVYLNCATQGGGTEFTKINRTFTPKRGTAIIWNNLDVNGYPNDGTMHAGLPVEDGEKIVITKWFRERGQGLMFMDPLFA